MEQIVIKFKAKDSEIVAYPLCLRNISKESSVDNTKKTGLNGYAYDFSVDYNAIAVTDVDIHMYLMKKDEFKSFKSKIKIRGNTPDDGNSKDVEIIVPLKYLTNFLRTLEIPLINCEVNLILTWSSTCIITNSTGAGTFEITDTKL